MTLPRFYREREERSIVTYDWTDIGSGTGIIKFRGFSGVNISTGEGRLNRDLLRTKSVEKTLSVGNGTTTTDYKLPTFTKNTVVKGVGYVTYMISKDGTLTGGTIYPGAKIIKDDGTSETEVGTVRGYAETWSGSATWNRVILVIEADETIFKPGDTLILRLVFERTGASGSANIYIGQSPYNEDGAHIAPSSTNYFTTLDFFCPFKIDL